MSTFAIRSIRYTNHMRFSTWFWLADLILLGLILWLNSLAWQYFWYWRFDQYGFDKLMHFLAGLFIGLTVTGIWVWWCHKKQRPLKKRELLAWIGLAILAIGGVWEILERGYQNHEFLYWIKPFALMSQGWFDSVTDFISDLLGGLAGASSFKLWNQTKN